MDDVVARPHGGMPVEHAPAGALRDVVDDERGLLADGARLGDVDLLTARVDLEVVQHGEEAGHAGRAVVLVDERAGGEVEGGEPPRPAPLPGGVERPEPAPAI